MWSIFHFNSINQTQIYIPIRTLIGRHGEQRASWVCVCAIGIIGVLFVPCLASLHYSSWTSSNCHWLKRWVSYSMGSCYDECESLNYFDYHLISISNEIDARITYVWNYIYGWINPFSCFPVSISNTKDVQLNLPFSFIDHLSQTSSQDPSNLCNIFGLFML